MARIKRIWRMKCRAPMEPWKPSPLRSVYFRVIRGSNTFGSDAKAVSAWRLRGYGGWVVGAWSRWPGGGRVEADPALKGWATVGRRYATNG